MANVAINTLLLAPDGFRMMWYMGKGVAGEAIEIFSSNKPRPMKRAVDKNNQIADRIGENFERGYKTFKGEIKRVF